jgi:hypothetical protein
MKTRSLAALEVAAALLAFGGSPDASTGTAARAGGYRIVIASDLDYENRPYTIELDGSRLTPLVSRERLLTPFSVSSNGRVIAYSGRKGNIYVSSGNGTGLRWVRGATGAAAVSPDGRRIAYSPGIRGPLVVAGIGGRRRRVLGPGPAEEINWAPDGRALVYTVRTRRSSSVVIQSLPVRRRVLAQKANAPKWSPNGRLIAYGSQTGLHLVHPDGQGRRRVGLGGSFSWSPDGRLAVASGRDISIVRSDGRVLKRFRLPGQQEVWTVLWAPDGRNLLIQLYPPHQIFVVGTNGKGLRRVTRLGNSSLVGWTRAAPVRPPLPALFPTERLVGPRTVSTRTPIDTLSADGGRVAFAARGTAADCGHVAVWTPAARKLVRFARRAPCRDWPPRSRVYAVALGGDRLAWTTERNCPNSCEGTLDSRKLGAPRTDRLAVAGSDGYPLARGHGDLLVFNDGSRLVRIGSGTEPCQEEGPGPADICTTLRRGEHSVPVDSVSGRLIAVREERAAAVLDDHGTLVRIFAFEAGDVTGAKLDGNHLVVAHGRAIEVYDIATGALQTQRPLPANSSLAEVDGGVAVLVGGKTIVLLRLQDGRTKTIAPGLGPVLAELEPDGLYYSHVTRDGGGRLQFLPRAEADPE